MFLLEEHDKYFNSCQKLTLSIKATTQQMMPLFFFVPNTTGSPGVWTGLCLQRLSPSVLESNPSIEWNGIPQPFAMELPVDGPRAAAFTAPSAGTAFSMGMAFEVSPVSEQSAGNS